MPIVKVTGEVMVKSKIAMLLLAALSVTACMAQEPSAEDAIRKSIEPKLREGVKIDSIKATPYAGLYEVNAAGDILYTDKKGEFLFIGEVINAKTSRNLTKERVDEINRIKLSDLPLDSALKTVKGDGKRTVMLFEDPELRLLQAVPQNHAEGPGQRDRLHLHVQHPVRGFGRQVEEYLVLAGPQQGLG
jgi:thiol:disulfide interchange protein DsbC